MVKRHHAESVFFFFFFRVYVLFCVHKTKSRWRIIIYLYGTIIIYVRK